MARDTTLRRLRALLARARGDDVAYRDLAVDTARRSSLASMATSRAPRRCVRPAAVVCIRQAGVV